VITLGINIDVSHCKMRHGNHLLNAIWNLYGMDITRGLVAIPFFV
jgi:hypothetical protein